MPGTQRTCGTAAHAADMPVPRAGQWEKTSNVCWYGVYFGVRTFLPLGVRSVPGMLDEFGRFAEAAIAENGEDGHITARIVCD